MNLFVSNNHALLLTKIYKKSNLFQYYMCFPVCCFQVVEADIFSAESLKTHFKGQDVIMSCLGFPVSIFSAVTGYTLSMKVIISAMREAQVNRIITMTSWYTERKRSIHDEAFCGVSTQLL